MLTFTRLLNISVLFSVCRVYSAEEGISVNQRIDGLEILCGETRVRLTVKRDFFKQRRVPFKPELVRLGQKSSCGAERLLSATELLISAKLQDCGTEARILGDWLVYSNKLFLFPVIISSSTGNIVRGEAAIIPIECYYERKQTVKSEPLTPTWVPMTSTISSFGLLDFSLQIMEESCSSPRSSSLYQQGEAVFLEARVKAPLHPPLALYVDSCVATLKPEALETPSYKFISNHGCLMDSVLPGSSSRFLPRDKPERLCFSFKAFHFNQTDHEQMFISCNLRATLLPESPSALNKACYFNRPSFRWTAVEGDSARCKCCDSDCAERAEDGTSSNLVTEGRFEALTTAGPLHTVHPSHWTGILSVS